MNARTLTGISTWAIRDRTLFKLLRRSHAPSTHLPLPSSTSTARRTTTMTIIGVITRNALATTTSFIGASLWTKLLSHCVRRKWLQPRTARKVMHITTAPLFASTWPLYWRGRYSAFFAATVPLVFALRIARRPADDALVCAVAREKTSQQRREGGNETGDGTTAADADVDAKKKDGADDSDDAHVRRQASGPKAYGFIVAALTAIGWRDNVCTYIALSALCFGDGMADVIGTAINAGALPLRPRAFFAKRKTLPGTLACFFSTVAASWCWLRAPTVTMFVSPSEATATVVVGAAAAAALVELLPVEDNVTVPVTSFLVSWLLRQ